MDGCMNHFCVTYDLKKKIFSIKKDANNLETRVGNMLY